jgi:hypothetical protein
MGRRSKKTRVNIRIGIIVALVLSSGSALAHPNTRHRLADDAHRTRDAGTCGLVLPESGSRRKLSTTGLINLIKLPTMGQC